MRHRIIDRYLACCSYLAVAVQLGSGCASDFPNPFELSVKDFSVSDAPMTPIDLAVDDLGVSPDHDLAAGPDLAPLPPDLSLTCDLGTGSGDGGLGATLYLAGIGPAGALYTASFAPSVGWSSFAIDSSHALTDVRITRQGPGSYPLVIARQQDGTLSGAAWQPCTGSLSPIAQLFPGAFTSLRPDVVGGLTADVVFRGFVNNDTRYYHTRFDGASWDGASVQMNFTSATQPAAVRLNASVHTIFTGQDFSPNPGGKLYDGTVSDAAGGGSAAVVYDLGGTTAQSKLAPSAVVGLDGTVYVVFTGFDTNLYWTSKPAAASGFAKPALICPVGTCLATTDFEPVLALSAKGLPVVAFHGTNQQTYSSSLGTGGAWSSPANPSAGDPSNFTPALATGIDGADAELVYVRANGVPNHTRLVAGSWGTLVSLPTTFQAAPSLVGQ